MSEPRRVRGIVVGHGEIARGLVSAVRRIAGERADTLTVLSNDGVGPDVLRDRIDELAGDDPVLVFVDLGSGSCGMAALRCCRGRSAREVVSGVNLPMLLDFVFHDDLALDELAERVVARGKQAIDRTPGAR